MRCTLMSSDRRFDRRNDNPGAASDGGNVGLAVLSCMCYGSSCQSMYVTSSLRTGDRRFHDFVVTGGTVGCQYDNLQCHR